MDSRPPECGSDHSTDAMPVHCDGTPAPVEALSSLALLRGHSSIAIDHLGTRYVLRATRAGKLILTK
jgi:hemin uptake protein HemP